MPLPDGGPEQLDPSGTPTYGSQDIAPGFTPDPIEINVTSGGSLNVSAMGLPAGCTGFATRNPDYRLTLTDTTSFLRVYALSTDDPTKDVTLIINRHDGSWVCNDDSYRTSNPTVDLTDAPAGRYDIWVGSYLEADPSAATIYITEIGGRHPCLEADDCTVEGYTCTAGQCVIPE